MSLSHASKEFASRHPELGLTEREVQRAYRELEQAQNSPERYSSNLRTIEAGCAFYQGKKDIPETFIRRVLDDIYFKEGLDAEPN